MSSHHPSSNSSPGSGALGACARAVVALAIVSASLLPRAAVADDSGTREAGKHFQRGVSLYGETDYRAALVEFKRAYALAPNAAVLYNIGETEFQLQDYAGALTTFERYLTESTPTDSHRAEVDNSVEVLRARVGHLLVTTVPPGADIAIDDQNVGKTPLEKPTLVSIGHRKVVASMPGRPASTRYVDVAADDNLTVTMQLSAPVDASGGASPKPASPAREPEGASGGGSTWRIVGWIGTGVLGAGAITLAVLADRESSNLDKLRSSYPTTSAALGHEASLTTTYALLADSLAAAAILAGGITVFSTLSATSADPRARGSAGGVQVGVGPGSARFAMTF